LGVSGSGGGGGKKTPPPPPLIYRAKAPGRDGPTAGDPSGSSCGVALLRLFSSAPAARERHRREYRLRLLLLLLLLLGVEW